MYATRFFAGQHAPHKQVDRKLSTAMLLLNRTIDLITRAGLVLAIPLSLLLFLQWPQRDALGRYSREDTTPAPNVDTPSVDVDAAELLNRQLNQNQQGDVKKPLPAGN